LCFYCEATEDFIAINENITFEDYELQKMLFLVVVDNNAVESLEDLRVFITPVVGQYPVAVQNSTATIMITDNDSKLT